MALVGLAVGGVAAVPLSQLLAGLLFGIEPADPPTIALSAVLVVTVAVVAAWVPAWRAIAVDPITRCAGTTAATDLGSYSAAWGLRKPGRSHGLPEYSRPFRATFSAESHSSPLSQDLLRIRAASPVNAKTDRVKEERWAAVRS